MPSRSAAASPAVLSVSSPAEILAAVPYLVGFHPDSSLVAMALRGSRRRVGLTMRLDLPPDDERDKAACYVAHHLARDGADDALVVLYDPPASSDGTRPGTELAQVVRRRLRSRGLALSDALGVCGRRWWSYHCSDPPCCPAEGNPVARGGAAEAATSDAGISNVQAHFVWAGRAPANSRDELAASLTALPDTARPDLAAAYGRAAAQPLTRSRALRLWQQHLTAWQTDGQPQALTDDQAAQLATAVADVRVRDSILGAAAAPGPRLDALVGLLRALTPLARPPVAATVAAMLAWAAYCASEGALASVAVEHALALDPSHTLANGIDGARQSGVRPEQLQRISSQMLLG